MIFAFIKEQRNSWKSCNCGPMAQLSVTKLPSNINRWPMKHHYSLSETILTAKKWELERCQHAPERQGVRRRGERLCPAEFMVKEHTASIDTVLLGSQPPKSGLPGVGRTHYRTQKVPQKQDIVTTMGSLGMEVDVQIADEKSDFEKR